MVMLKFHRGESWLYKVYFQTALLSMYFFKHGEESKNINRPIIAICASLRHCIKMPSCSKHNTLFFVLSCKNKPYVLGSFSLTGHPHPTE